MMFSLQNCEFEGFTYKCTLGVVVTLVGGKEVWTPKFVNVKTRK